MTVTLRDVAEKAGVSAMTVSRVINGAAGVRDDTRRRVEEVIAALDYVPNRIARGLLSSRTARCRKGDSCRRWHAWRCQRDRPADQSRWWSATAGRSQRDRKSTRLNSSH